MKGAVSSNYKFIITKSFEEASRSPSPADDEAGAEDDAGAGDSGSGSGSGSGRDSGSGSGSGGGSGSGADEEGAEEAEAEEKGASSGEGARLDHDNIVPFTPERPKVGRPAELAPAVAALEAFFSADVGLKAPDVPKAMALVQAECIEHPDEMLELARAGWVPREAEGFTALSFMGRGRLGAWVEWAAAQAAGGGRGPGRQPAARAAAPLRPLFSPARSADPWSARREPPREPAPASPAAVADADGTYEARVPLT